MSGHDLCDDAPRRPQWPPPDRKSGTDLRWHCEVASKPWRRKISPSLRPRRRGAAPLRTQWSLANLTSRSPTGGGGALARSPQYGQPTSAPRRSRRSGSLSNERYCGSCYHARPKHSSAAQSHLFTRPPLDNLTGRGRPAYVEACRRGWAPRSGRGVHPYPTFLACPRITFCLEMHLSFFQVASAHAKARGEARERSSVGAGLRCSSQVGRHVPVSSYTTSSAAL